ncbi:EAL domain-containing protein [Sphingomonadaceae bacterium]|nr:EAL domain-containing protein [Sphingomonadaceae bacterium]
MVWTALIAAIIGVIEMPLPVEDAYRAARAELRAKPAPDNIVLLKVDDRTLRILSRSEPSRSQVAQVVDTLFSLDADRVVFDRAFADPTTEADDKVLAEALSRHGSRVRIGASPIIDNGSQQHEALLPNSTLRPSAHLASMLGESSPFSLSANFDTSATVDGQQIPGIAAFLAGYTGPKGSFRPDFAYRIADVPTMSFVDVLNGDITEQQVSGKRFIVAPTHITNTDMHRLPLGEEISGAYFHILAAHTLSGGLPVDLGWIPATILAVLLVGLQARSKRPRASVFWTGTTFLLVAPFFLDSISLNLDVMPGLMTLIIGNTWLARAASKTFTGETNLLQSKVLEGLPGHAVCDVFALKIRNFPAISASIAGKTSSDIADLIVSRIAPIEQATSYAFENNTIIWLKPSQPAKVGQDHAAGILALFRHGIPLESIIIQVEVGMGLDANTSLPIRQRIHNALQCAEDAVKSDTGIRAADDAYLLDREWRSQTLSELDAALESKSVGVAYQPKVIILSGRVSGAEALLRWEHPEKGPIPAKKIVALAEESGRITRLTEYVLDIALSEAHEAIAVDPRFRMAVNVSARSLADKSFLGIVAGKLAEHHFPAENLILEITETSPLNDPAMLNTLLALRQMKINLSIDDFGTGQSNLENVRAIPEAEIKIDRQFVDGMDKCPEKAAVVCATIEMAHALKRSVVAEGVESKAVANALREMGCHEAQGFLYSQATSMRELLGHLYRGQLAA